MSRDLPSPIILLIGLPLVVFGGWLNSYGIDRASVVLTIIGWLGMVIGGFPFGWFVMVLLAHFVN